MTHRPVRLETERLILRAHELQDFDAMAAMWADPRVAQFIGGTASTPEQSWARLIRYIGFWPALGFGYFAILDKASGQFIGEAGLADFHRDINPPLDGTAEAGWALMPNQWGKGYATEALIAILDWYQALPNARAVSCIIDPDNEPSNRLAAKVGFRLICVTEYKGTKSRVLFI